MSSEFRRADVPRSLAPPEVRASAAAVPVRNNAARLFGYDLFISFALGPPPRSSRNYAADLARRLRELDFNVFFSEEEAPPGGVLDSTLVNALKRSRALVVVANRGTLKEPRWVRREVEEYRRLNPKGAVIPISIAGALQDPALAASAHEWLAFQDKIWLDEPDDATATGIASEAVVQRLAVAPDWMRSSVKWRWAVRAVVVALAGLAIGLGVAARVASLNADEALKELRSSTAQRLADGAQGLLDGERVGGVELGLQGLLAAHAMAPSLEVGNSLQQAVIAQTHVSKVVHSGSPVLSVAFSGDGQQILSDHEDGILRTWDAASGMPVGPTPPAHRKPAIIEFKRVAYSADNRLALETDSEGGLTLIEVVGARVLASQGEAHRAGYGTPGAAFSPDGRYIATGNNAGIRIWDGHTLKPVGGVRRSDDRFDSAHALAFSPDGGWLVTGRHKATDLARLEFDDKAPELATLVLWKWNGQALQKMGTFNDSADDVTSVVFSPDGQFVVSGGSDGRVRGWNVRDRRSAGPPVFSGLRDGVRSLANSRDGMQMVVGGADGSLVTLQAAGLGAIGQPLSDNGEPSANVRHLMFSPDGSLLAVKRATSVHLWDMTTTRRLGALPMPREIDHGSESPDSQIPGLSFSGDGTRMASGSLDGSIQLWDARRVQRLGRPWSAHRGPVQHLAFSPDGKTIASGGEDGQLVLWTLSNPPDPPQGDVLDIDGQPVRRVAFSPEGSRLAVGTKDGLLRLFDTASRRLLVKANLLEETEADAGLADAEVNSLWLAFSAEDGRQLLAGFSDSQSLFGMQVRDGSSLKVSHRTEVPDGISSAALHPDGSVQAWGTQRGLIEIRSTTTGEMMDNLPLRGHARVTAVNALVFGGDGRTLVSAGADSTVRLWAWEHGVARSLGVPWRGHTAERGVLGLAMSPDGKLIASSDADGSVRLWPGRAAWADLLCAKLTRNMSRQAWRDNVSARIDYVRQCEKLPVPD